MDNLKIYNKVKEVPANAQKAIQGGRLKGFTDINPMWRIKTLTELFGPCGTGWKTIITNKWIEEGANGEKSAFINIELFYKQENEWSEAVIGTGGSAFVDTQKGSLYMSDECFKMAYTDAISVACKSLGFGANVYWDKDRTKYSASLPGSETSEKTEWTQETILTFGTKHKGEKVSEILKTDRGYIEWLAKNANETGLKNLCIELIKNVSGESKNSRITERQLGVIAEYNLTGKNIIAALAYYKKGSVEELTQKEGTEIINKWKKEQGAL